MINIFDIREKPELQKDAVDYFWNHWGSDSNLNFYRDCIERSCDTKSDIPRFYLALEGNKVVGSYFYRINTIFSKMNRGGGPFLIPHSCCGAYAPWSARGISEKLILADNPALAKSVGSGATRLKPVRVREYKNVIGNTGKDNLF